MIRSIASRHPPRARLQQPPTSIHHRTNPKPIIGLDPRARQPANVAVHVDGLPVALGDVVQLVVDTHVAPLLDVFVPPLPRLHVVRAVGKIVDAFDGLKVRDNERFVLGCATGGVEPVGGAHEAEFLVVGLEVDDHLLEELADLLDAWGEDSERVVVAEADVKDREVCVGGFAAVGAAGVREGRGEFVHHHAVHEGVVFETGRCGGGVGYGVKDVKSCWEEGDPADEHECHGLE